MQDPDFWKFNNTDGRMMERMEGRENDSPVDLSGREGAERPRYETLTWDCPECGFDNTDEILPDEGPFLTLTCGGVCGKAFDRDVINPTVETDD